MLQRTVASAVSRRQARLLRAAQALDARHPLRGGAPRLRRGFRPVRAEAEAGSEPVEPATAAAATDPEPQEVEEQSTPPSSGPPPGPEFVPVCYLDDLPKGTRKDVTVEGKAILLFWYRNKVYAIESRSTAEGYYSEGFKTAKFTQDYGIVCPSTGTVFSIRDGSIVEWYPNNPVLRQLTPVETCRPIEIYQMAEHDNTLYVNPEGSLANWVPASGLRSDFTMPGQLTGSKGGSDTSLENNNVYGIEPKMYLEGTDPGTAVGEDSVVTAKLSPVTVIVGTIAVGIGAVAGTGVCLYYENFIALGIFWLVGLGAVGYTAQKFSNFGADEDYPA